MKNSIAVALFLGVLLGQTFAFAQPRSLDGTLWKARRSGVLGRILFGHDAILDFHGGMLTVSDGDKRGGKGVPYSSHQANGVTTWKAEQITKKGEKIDLLGTLRGARMDFTITVTKPGRGAVKRDFSATRWDPETIASNK